LLAATGPMARRLVGGALVLGALALAACGSEGGSVQAGGPVPDETTTTTTTVPETTTTLPATTTAPTTTSVPTTVVPAAGPPCTDDTLQAAANEAYGNQGAVTAIDCVGEWASGSSRKGEFDPPIYMLFRAEGDYWVAVERGIFECEPLGVPPGAARQLGC
jgi:hypothetical protein